VFKSKQMAKVQVLCLGSDLEAALRLMQEASLIEVVRNTDARLGSGRQPRELGDVMSYLMKFNGVLGYLGESSTPLVPSAKSLDALLSSCALEGEILSEVEGLMKKAAEADKARKELERAIGFVERLKSLSFDPNLLSVKSLSFFLGRIPTHNIQELRESLYHITGSFDLRSARLNRFDSICLLAVDRRFESQVEGRLQANAFAKMTDADLSNGVGVGLASLQARLESNKRVKAEVESQRVALASRNAVRITGLRDLLEAEKARLELQVRFGTTRETVAIEGWVEAAKFNEFRATIMGGLGGRALVELFKTDEMPPTVSSVPNSIKPFSDFVEFISVPNPREIDPTVAFALVFPIFYGMMLGDVGYGLMSLLLGIVIARRFSGLVKSIGVVLVISSFSTIIFGAFYDEFFGFNISKLLGFSLINPHVERLGNLELLLAASVALGVIHITAGLVLGLINSLREGKVRHALGKVGWIGVEFTLVLFSASYLLQYMSPPDYLLLLGLVSLILIYGGEGYVGLMELPGIASNIMSYTRIVAIGVSSLAIASVINSILMPNPGNGILSVALTLPLFLLSHLANLVLGVFESMVQAARLNYVEFFSKFFEGGGRRFKPFSFEKKYLMQGGV